MFDLLVIGAGPGGYTAAARAAKLGLSTAIVEERSWGGTCLNRGCVPTKTLLHASEVYRSAADGAAIGIHAEGLRADIPEIFAYKERISRQLCGGGGEPSEGRRRDAAEGGPSSRRRKRPCHR